MFVCSHTHFGTAAGDSKAVGGGDALDLLVHAVARWNLFSNVFLVGMRGSKPDGISLRRSARLEKKRGNVIMHDLPSTSLDWRLRTISRLEGDIIVLSLDKSAPTSLDPTKVVGLFTPNKARRTEAESEEEEIFDAPMVPCTRLKYSRFRGDKSQDVDDWYREFESIATANEEDPEAKRRIFQGLLKGEVLKWYQDVPDITRDSWADFVPLILKTFREAGGEARALGRLSRMTKKPAE